MTAYLVGLTGRIGSGKSTVGRMLEGLGATVVDADELVHELMRPGHPAFARIHATFGREVLAEDGTVDRAKLAQKVFADPQALRRLEQITHPQVIARVLDMRAGMFDDSTLVVEAIKLLESPLAGICQEIWVTVAPEDLLVERLRERGVSAGEARMRLAAQMPTERMRERATVMLENDGDLAALARQVKDAWRRSLERRRGV